MKAFHRRRLEKLRDFLKTIPPKKFNMEMWMDLSGIQKEFEKPINANLCGTAGCAVGWATTIPSFRRAGLGLYQMKNVWHDQSTGCNVRYLNPKTKEYYSDFYGVAIFFGIDYHDAEYLFSPDEYSRNRKVTPKMVAARINEFLKEDRAGCVS